MLYFPEMDRHHQVAVDSAVADSAEVVLVVEEPLDNYCKTKILITGGKLQ